MVPTGASRACAQVRRRSCFARQEEPAPTDARLPLLDEPGTKPGCCISREEKSGPSVLRLHRTSTPARPGALHGARDAPWPMDLATGPWPKQSCVA
jgi:hypothetical protein